MISEEAIKIWVDESTEINGQYILIGYLITNANKEEYDFFKKLTEARGELKCFKTLHGCEMSEECREIKLLDKWLSIFVEANNGIYFHAFLYKKNEKYISTEETFEHYFAKQSIFSLSLKMNKKGYPVQTMFGDVSTLFILFDNRQSHSADIIHKKQGKDIFRIHALETIYRDSIVKQIENRSKRNSKTTDLTVRFSFVSDECFDGIQFTDCLVYLIRQKLESVESNQFTKLFDKYFLDHKDKDVQELGFKKIYEYDKKFNFFESVK